MNYTSDYTSVRHSVAFLAVAALLGAGTSGRAEESSRQQQVEIFTVGQWSGSGKVTSFRFSDNFLGGLGVGYNLTDQLNVNLDAEFSKVNLASTTAPVTVDATRIAAHLNLDYNLFRSALTPFVTGGVGVDSYDGNQGLTAISKAEFSYKVGGGLRWDISRHFFAKGLYRAAWADVHKGSSAHTISVMLGYKF